MALGEVHPGEALVELGTEERDSVGALRRVLAEQLVDEIADPLLVGAERGLGDGHGLGYPLCWQTTATHYLTRGSIGPGNHQFQPASHRRRAPTWSPIPGTALRRRARIGRRASSLALLERRRQVVQDAHDDGHRRGRQQHRRAQRGRGSGDPPPRTVDPVAVVDPPAVERIGEALPRAVADDEVAGQPDAVDTHAAPSADLDGDDAQRDRQTRGAGASTSWR